MKYYSVAELDVTDGRWVRAYVENVTTMVERYGGRYLSRTGNFERMEGQRKNPQVFLIIEWPSREAALAFYDSPEYRPYRQSRLEGSRGEFVLVAGEDMNKLARMGGEAPPYWFPAKRRGWGWGPPVAWQGRVFLGTWVAIVIVSSPLLVQRGLPLFLSFFVGMLAVLLAVCFAKGEPPKWRS